AWLLISVGDEDAVLPASAGCPVTPAKSASVLGFSAARTVNCRQQGKPLINEVPGGWSPIRKLLLAQYTLEEWSTV
ncbi:MAG TPA: hypothetical protein VHY59_12145, partial [Chthoniobacterales bacterium]|nr:hypothetical protein [Chthoniobacterales bacterium]